MNIKEWYPTLVVTDKITRATQQANASDSGTGAILIRSEMKVFPPV